MSVEADVRSLYLNPKQQAVRNYLMQPCEEIEGARIEKTAVMIGGRGAGKSDIAGGYLDWCIDTMPRGRFFIAGATMEIVENRSLPSMIEHWERLGYEEGEDFIIGKKPPSWFDTPYSRVKDYSSVVSWWNGAIVEMISLYSARGARGPNYQGGVIDEAALADPHIMRANLFPAIRGNYWREARIELAEWQAVPWGSIEEAGGGWVWVLPFRENPLYCSKVLISSMPWLEQGKYLLEYANNPHAFYIEATAQDNIEVVGPGYIPRLRRELTDLEFRVEVMNERIDHNPNGFYPCWSDDVHTTLEDYYQHTLPLDISFDFGANFSCVTIYQHLGDIVAGLSEIYVKGETVDRLVDRFIEHYQHHRRKVVHVFGDRNGNNRRFNSKTTLYQDIVARLRRAGWAVVLEVRGLDPPHADKFRVISKIMEEQPNSRLPKLRLHRVRCKNLIMSVKLAPTKAEFRKDKRSEHPSNPTPDEHATHLSDTLDNYLHPKLRHLAGGVGVGGGPILA